MLFIDSDDYLKPDSLRHFVKALKEHPGVDMVMGNAFEMKSHSLMYHYALPELIDSPSQIIRGFLRRDISVYAWNKLIRRDIIVDNQLYFIEDIIYEDQAWTFLLPLYLKSVVIIPEATYVYEDNPDGICNSVFNKKMSVSIR